MQDPSDASGRSGPAAPRVAVWSSESKRLHTQRTLSELEAFFFSGARLRFDSREAPEVSVLLVLYNRAELTLRCLRSLAVRLPFPIELILVDNASSDATGRLLRHLYGATILRNGENRGFTLAVNQAAAAARGRYLLTLNNDSELLPGSLAAALETMRSEPGAGAVVARILNLDGSLQEAGSIVWNDASCRGYGRGEPCDRGEFLYRRDVDFGSAAFMLTETELFRSLGGFDEAYSPAYYEDTDYCMRVWKAGRRVIYEPRAAIVHYEFASSELLNNQIALQVERQAIFRRHHADVLPGHLPPADANVLEARGARRDRPRILVFDDRVPHPWLGSGFPRAANLMKRLVELGWHVTFVPLSVVEDYRDRVIETLPPSVEVLFGWPAARVGELLAARRGAFDRVLVSRSHNLRRLLPYLEELAQIGLIFDAEAITARRDVLRRRQLGEEVPADEERALVLREVELARAARAVLAVNEAERRWFADGGCREPCVLGLDVTERPGPASLAGRSEILMVGGVLEESSPNADALEWLAGEILPEVERQLGRPVRFRMVGPVAPPRLRALASERVRVDGMVGDLGPIYDGARLHVAPTRFAAGVPQKIVQAAARGVPQVTTPLIAAQLGWTDGEEILCGGDAAAIARQCVRLLTDDDLWHRVREGALRRVREEHSAESFVRTLGRALELAGWAPGPVTAPAGAAA